MTTNVDKFGTDFEEYKKTDGAEYTESKFIDSLGRELESARCEFCQVRKPIRVWIGPDFNSRTFRENYHVMMHDYEKDGQTYWVCNDCNKDMEINRKQDHDSDSNNNGTS